MTGQVPRDLKHASSTLDLCLVAKFTFTIFYVATPKITTATCTTRRVEERREDRKGTKLGAYPVRRAGEAPIPSARPACVGVAYANQRAARLLLSSV